MRILRTLCALALATGLAIAQNPPTSVHKEAKPASKLGFDVNNLDRTADPCTDFFQYACGTWIKNNPIPGDQSRWTRFNELAERSRADLRTILESAAQGKGKRDTVTQQIGDYYASCMDENAANRAGAKPVQPHLRRIAALKSRKDLIAEVGRLHSQGISALFGFGATQDFRDANQMIAAIDQGGLGLPDRDYYIKDDAKSKETREKYAEHVANTFVLLGRTREQAQAAAKAVLALETQLAQASMDRVSRRDPHKRDNKMKRAEFVSSAPAFELETYFATANAPQFTELNVGNPAFFKQVNAVLENSNLDDWKTYLTWHVLRASSPLLSKEFVDENFRFYSAYMQGQKEQKPRWNRCVQMVDGDLGEALGQKYVAKHFPPASKQRMEQLVANLLAAMKDDIQQLDWMTDATKKRALEKLGTFKYKIGYPNKWIDYSTVKIARNDLLGNSIRAGEFNRQRNLKKIGKQVDREEWFMSPPTVNAYYSGARNEIVFPAGILQPPFFELTMDDAVNYGGIGMVIGHEITHGFDDQGRKFDAQGNLTDWWTAADATEFEQRANCIVEQYSAYSPVAGVNLNGKLTLGENTADLGGSKIAFMALMKELADKKAGDSAEKIDGFTPEQRFFLGTAQVWCGASTEQTERLRALTDPHSPGRFRVIGPAANLPEFQKAFGCKQGQPMVRADACRVW